MSVSHKCRGTAARYQRLAELSESADMRRSYRELQFLWLEMAALSERLDPLVDFGQVGPDHAGAVCAERGSGH